MGYVWVDDKEDDAKFIAHVETITKSLSNTNSGLLADIQKYKTKLLTFEGIDPVEVTRIKNELQVLKDKSKENETELEKQIRLIREQNEVDTKALKETVELLNSSNKKLLVDDEITKALLSIKVKDTMVNAAKRIIKEDVSVIEENGIRKAVVGDKTIEEHVKTWASTEEGKNFVLAPKNNGGDSIGNDNNSETELEQEKYFIKDDKNYNMTKQLFLKKTNKELYDKIVNKLKK